jgi:hypothetical protein
MAFMPPVDPNAVWAAEAAILHERQSQREPGSSQEDEPGNANADVRPGFFARLWARVRRSA